MISAAKADGQVDQAEMEKIIGKISADSVTPEEKAVRARRDARAARHPGAGGRTPRTPAQAAEVYAASLLAIDIDTDHERQYLRDLAAGAEARRRHGAASCTR